MVTIRRKAAHFLRKLNLLHFADRVMFFGNVLINKRANKRFLAGHPEFLHPPAHLAYDAYGNINWQLIYEMGLEASRLISGFIKEYVQGNDIRICEWGCGPGRVIRHFDKIDGFDKVELFGTDYNEKTINWCKENIPNVHFNKNNLEPPLPLQSEMFDCVYAISVFTHLSERMHYAWVEELFRILKPNGILIFTTHGDLCSKSLLKEERERYDSGVLVVKDKIEEGKKHFLAYHPPKFIKESLLNGNDILEHIESEKILSHFCQDIWVVKKRS